MNNARILILEDDPNWIRTIRQALGGAASRAADAATLTEAAALLERRYFNVAIVDISLRLGDPDDDQGMQFLKLLRDKGLAEAVRPIVFSNYGNLRHFRRAFAEFQVVDFLEKTPFDERELVRAVEQALAANHLDRPLEIELVDGGDLEALWARFDWARREDPDELRPELSDLLRRLFPEATHLVLRDLLAGQSGAGVLQVEPFHGANAAAAVIVKFGKREKARQEHKHYVEHVHDYAGAQSTTELGCALGRALGAICYRLIGASLQRVDSFARFYANHSAQEVCNALDHLFREACGLWYENREQPRRTHNLVKLYEEGLRIKWQDEAGPHDRWEEIWEGAAAAGLDPDAAQWHFPGLAGALPNPRAWLARRNFRIFLPAYRSVTHGDLNEHNVLVTEDGRCWLIDFYRTGLGHVLRDAVELETAIKFNLAGFDDLAEYRRFEALLASQKRIDQPVQPDPGDPHQKALAIIGHLRRLADAHTGSGNDMREYNSALLLATLNLLRLEFMAGQHLKALLSAGMLCETLEKGDR